MAAGTSLLRVVQEPVEDREPVVGFVGRVGRGPEHHPQVPALLRYQGEPRRRAPVLGAVRRAMKSTRSSPAVSPLYRIGSLIFDDRFPV